MMKSIRSLVAVIAVVCISVFSQAQVTANEPAAKKPYKILTSGKQITVKSPKNIKHIMVWTSTGHRIIEQKDINEPSFTFNVNVNSRVFFIMIHLEGAKPYTEKIGI